MSKNKDGANEEFNVYSSDYIDFTPPKTKSNRFSKIIIFISFVIFLIALFSVLWFRIEPSVTIDKIEQRVGELIDKQNKLEDSVQKKGFQLDKISGEELKQIIMLDSQLKDTTDNLQEIKRKLAQGKDTQINKRLSENKTYVKSK